MKMYVFNRNVSFLNDDSIKKFHRSPKSVPTLPVYSTYLNKPIIKSCTVNSYMGQFLYFKFQVLLVIDLFIFLVFELFLCLEKIIDISFIIHFINEFVQFFTSVDVRDCSLFKMGMLLLFLI